MEEMWKMSSKRQKNGALDRIRTYNLLLRMLPQVFRIVFKGEDLTASTVKCNETPHKFFIEINVYCLLMIHVLRLLDALAR